MVHSYKKILFYRELKKIMCELPIWVEKISYKYHHPSSKKSTDIISIDNGKVVFESINLG